MGLEGDVTVLVELQEEIDFTKTKYELRLDTILFGVLNS